VINIATFLTHIPVGTEKDYNYDLREPKRKIIHPDKIKETKRAVVHTNDWTNIPYYPTTLERKENVVKHLISMGKPDPHALLQQLATEKQKHVHQDAFNKHILSPPPPPSLPLPPQRPTGVKPMGGKRF